jgi:hypothetical protein
MSVGIPYSAVLVTREPLNVRLAPSPADSASPGSHRLVTLTIVVDPDSAASQFLREAHGRPDLQIADVVDQSTWTQSGAFAKDLQQ